MAPVALVTGASGFTGRYVCKALQEVGYSILRWGHISDCGAREVNLNDRAQVRSALSEVSPQVVVHLAGIAFVAHGDVDAIYRTNIVGTRNLLEALTEQPKKPLRVLIASSASVYGNAEGILSEDAITAPQNDYAVSKLAMEHMAALWSGRLPITVVRPFNYTGVGQPEKYLLPKIVSHFARREPVIELGNIDVSRDFNDVRNVSDIYTRLLTADVEGKTLNVCSGQEHSLARVIEIMREISGHQIEISVNPAFVRSNEVKRLRGDSRRLGAAIGALPPFSLETTLDWMYKGFVIGGQGNQ